MSRETSRVWREQVRFDAGTASTLAKERNGIRIPSKVDDMLIDPSARKQTE